jgi:hypothetical protein
MATGIAGLSISIPQGLKRILSVNVTQQMRGDNKVIREFRSGKVQHAWEFGWNTLSRDERRLLDLHFAANRGRITTFTFVDPWDNVSYTVRYDHDEIMFKEDAPFRWGSSIRLLEVANFKTLKSSARVFPQLSTGAVVQLPYQMGRQYRTQIEIQEDFTEKRWEDYATVTGFRRWSVGGDILTDAEALTFMNFWEAMFGSYRYFAFTEPETGVGFASVHFIENSITHTISEYNCNSIRATIEELSI